MVKGELHENVLQPYEAERHPVIESFILGTCRAYQIRLYPTEMLPRTARIVGFTANCELDAGIAITRAGCFLTGSPA